MNVVNQQTEQNKSPINDAHKALVEIYNQQMPDPLKSYQDGVKAGIRYALIAMGEKVEGIDLKREDGGYGEKHVR